LTGRFPKDNELREALPGSSAIDRFIYRGGGGKAKGVSTTLLIIRDVRRVSASGGG